MEQDLQSLAPSSREDSSTWMMNILRNVDQGVAVNNEFIFWELHEAFPIFAGLNFDKRHFQMNYKYFLFELLLVQSLNFASSGAATL
jgi:hypothetical protein